MTTYYEYGFHLGCGEMNIRGAAWQLRDAVRRAAWDCGPGAVIIRVDIFPDGTVKRTEV